MQLQCTLQLAGQRISAMYGGLTPTQQHHWHRRLIPNNVYWKLICNKGCHIFYEREDLKRGMRRGSTMTISTSWYLLHLMRHEAQG